MARREGLTEKDKRKIFEENIVPMGLYALRQAKKNAPVDTGRLRASITLADTEDVLQPVGNEARSGDGVDQPTGEYKLKLGTNVNYAKFIEYGTIYMSPQPFLRPAVDAALTKFDIERT